MLCVLELDCLQTCNNKNMSQCTTPDKVVSWVLSSAILWVCGQTRGRGGCSVRFMVNGMLDWWYRWLIFPKSSKNYLEAWLVHMHHQLSRWCPATTVSQTARCSTLTLSWFQGKKWRCTSLRLCRWRAARPIRPCAVSHHVTASPIAIYSTISQMKRLILTICSLMCCSRSGSFSPSFTILVPFFPAVCSWVRTKS